MVVILDTSDEVLSCNNNVLEEVIVLFFRKQEMRTNRAVATMFVAGVSCW